MIVFWGAGAIGGTIGAYLARAGHDVLFVDVAADHVEAIDREGLRIEGPVDEFRVKAKAVTPDKVEGVFDRIVLAVKAHHTEGALPALLPHLAKDGFILSAQNGLNEIAIARVAGAERTMGCFVNFGADWHSPGRILYGGHGAVVVGELDGKRTKHVEEMYRLLKVFEPDAVLTDNIWGYLWGKLGYGAMLFATALTEASIADALAEPRYNDVFRRIGNEVMAVAAKKGIRCEGFNGFDPAAFAPGGSDEAVRRSMAGMVAHNRGSAKTHSGIYRDLAVRKRRTEVDAQVGMVVEQAREEGIPAPTLAKLVTLIHDIEEGRRPMAWATLDALC